MKLHARIILCYFVFTFSFSVSANQQEVQEFLKMQIGAGSEPITGAAYAIFDDNNILEAAKGSARSWRHEGDEQEIMRVASISKVYTALAIYQPQAAGILELNDNTFVIRDRSLAEVIFRSLIPLSKFKGYRSKTCSNMDQQS